MGQTNSSIPHRVAQHPVIVTAGILAVFVTLFGFGFQILGGEPEPGPEPDDTVPAENEPVTPVLPLDSEFEDDAQAVVLEFVDHILACDIDAAVELAAFPFFFDSDWVTEAELREQLQPSAGCGAMTTADLYAEVHVSLSKNLDDVGDAGGFGDWSPGDRVLDRVLPRIAVEPLTAQVVGIPRERPELGADVWVAHPFEGTYLVVGFWN